MYRCASQAEWRALRDVHAEDIPGPEIFGTDRVGCDELRLGHLACSGRTHKDQAHYRRKPLVVAQHELALDLLHRVKADAHDDEHGGAAKRELL